MQSFSTVIFYRFSIDIFFHLFYYIYMFSLTCLGKNGLYPTKSSPTSGYLLTCGETRILLDVGSGVFSALLESFPPERINAVVISHFHGDHCSDTTVYDYYLQTKGNKIPLYAPTFDDERLVSSLRFFIPNEVIEN